MRRRIEQALAFYRSPLGKKLYRYVMGSVITTIVSFGVLTLVYGVFHWWGAVTSTVVANVVATIPAYYLNRQWTWGKYGRSDMWREIVPFWVISILGILISMGTASLAEQFVQAHHIHHLGATVIVDGANLAAYGILFIGKYLLFERLFKVAEALRAAHDAASATESELVAVGSRTSTTQAVSAETSDPAPFGWLVDTAPNKLPNLRTSAAPRAPKGD